MSFVITLNVREGIVMASDSRITLNSQEIGTNGTPSLNVAVGMSDSNYKTFLAYNKIGVSTCGQADIKGVPLSGYIETFIRNQQDGDSITPKIFGERIKDHFRTYNPIPNTYFHVAGYVNESGVLKQQVFKIDVIKDTIGLTNPEDPSIGETQGAIWDGESDILARIIKPLFIQVPGTTTFNMMPTFNIPWNFFTLQDAIDFAIFGIRSTIDTMKFQQRAKTVGGPIDVLVIKPTETLWVSRKELHS